MSVVLENVTLRYPRAEAPALSRVNAEFRVGELTLVTGKVGAGCSSLLMTIAGLAPRATGGEREGAVSTLGHDPATPGGKGALAGRVGVLLPTPVKQLSGMSFTVRDEVAFGPANLGWDRFRIAAGVGRALALLEIEHLATRDPRTLSGGELQRVMFAAVVSTEPAVYLLDEPAQELDPEGVRGVFDLLAQLVVDATVLLATSDVDRAVDFADRAILMDRGHVVADGRPDDVLSAKPIVQLGLSTTVATLGLQAGCPAPFPTTVQSAVERYRR